MKEKIILAHGLNSQPGILNTTMTKNVLLEDRANLKIAESCAVAAIRLLQRIEIELLLSLPDNEIPTSESVERALDRFLAVVRADGKRKSPEK